MRNNTMEQAVERQMRVYGRVLDVMQNVSARERGTFNGFIVAENGEKLFFTSTDLMPKWAGPVYELKNKIVVCDVITTPPHEKRQAVNVELLSGAQQ